MSRDLDRSRFLLDFLLCLLDFLCFLCFLCRPELEDSVEDDDMSRFLLFSFFGRSIESPAGIRPVTGTAEFEDPLSASGLGASSIPTCVISTAEVVRSLGSLNRVFFLSRWWRPPDAKTQKLGRFAFWTCLCWMLRLSPRNWINYTYQKTTKSNKFAHTFPHHQSYGFWALAIDHFRSRKSQPLSYDSYALARLQLFWPIVHESLLLCARN